MTDTVELSEQEYKELQEEVRLRNEETKDLSVNDRYDHPKNRKLIRNYVPWDELSASERNAFIDLSALCDEDDSYFGIVGVDRDGNFPTTRITIAVKREN